MGIAPSLAPPENVPSPSPPDADALFKEAKHRERRRRLLVAGALLAACLVVVAAVVAAGTFSRHVDHQSGGPTAASLHPFPSAGLPRCSSNSLHAGVTSLSSSPPQVNATLLTVTNEGSSACELFTFPVLQLVDGANKVIATAPHPGQADVKVHIPSGASAIADLYWQNWCGTAQEPLTLHVVLPNQGGTLSSPFGGPTSSLPSCTDPSHTSSLVATGGLDSGSLFGTGR
jgi:Domain of unknown function (DUF4232)